MADLVVKRAMAKRDLLRRYAIEIDGICLAHVRVGGTTHVKIAEGMRSVRLSIDGYSSKTETILASNQRVAILHCAAGALPIAPPQPRDLSFRNMVHLPLDRSSYIDADLEGRTDLARAFVQAAWSVARFQIQERTKPGDRSRYGLTAGELSVLYHACRIAEANMITSLGSANDRLWRELAHVGWLTDGTVAPVQLGQAAAYRLTEIGRTELLDILL
jgi:hypothetical protein